MTQTVYPNLSFQMLAKGLSTKDVAKASGKSVHTVNNWIAGRTKLNFEDALNVKRNLFPDESTEYLFAHELLAASSTGSE